MSNLSLCDTEKRKVSGFTRVGSILFIAVIFCFNPYLVRGTEVRTLEPVQIFNADGGMYVHDVAIDRDEEIIASGYQGVDIHVWNLSTGEQLRVLEQPGGPLTQLYRLATGRVPPTHSLAFAPKPPWGGGVLAAGYDDGVRLWNARTGELLVDQLPRSEEDLSSALAFSPEGVFLGSGSAAGEVSVWNTRSKKLMRQFRAHGKADTVSGGGYIETIDFSPIPVGKYLAVGTNEGAISVWNWRKELEAGQPESDTESFHVFSVRGFADTSVELLRGVEDVDFQGSSADSLTLVTAGFDGEIRRWSIPEGKLIHRFNVGTLDSFSLSPDGQYLAVGNDDVFELWSIDGEMLAQGKEHTNAIVSVSFSRSGKWILTGSGEINPRERDDRVILWENPFFEEGPPGEGHPPPSPHTTSRQSGASSGGPNA